MDGQSMLRVRCCNLGAIVVDRGYIYNWSYRYRHRLTFELHDSDFPFNDSTANHDPSICPYSCGRPVYRKHMQRQ